jgi:hypothetical protein
MNIIYYRWTEASSLVDVRRAERKSGVMAGLGGLNNVKRGASLVNIQPCSYERVPL